MEVREQPSLHDVLKAAAIGIIIGWLVVYLTNSY